MEKAVSFENLKTFLACINSQFVQKKNGYGLSANDYTDLDRERVRTMEPNAEHNTITSISIDGESLSVGEDRDAVVEVVGEADILALDGEAKESVGGAEFDVATESEIYSIVHS